MIWCSSFLSGATSPKTDDIYFFTDESWDEQKVVIHNTNNSKPNIILNDANTINNWYNKPITAQLTAEIDAYLQASCNPKRTGIYVCENMLLGFRTENWTLNPTTLSNTNDYGICQLNKPSHKWFFKNADWTNWKVQADYCAWVWNNAFERWIHPKNRWLAIKNRPDVLAKMIENANK